MSENLRPKDDFFEHLSLILNKTVVAAKLEQWMSVISECLGGLSLVARTRQNPEKMRKVAHSSELRTRLNEMEKRYR